MTPGIHPKIVKQMLMMKFDSQPVLRKTGMGGMKIARKYRRTSEVDDGGRAIVLWGLRAGLELRRCLELRGEWWSWWCLRI